MAKRKLGRGLDLLIPRARGNKRPSPPDAADEAPETPVDAPEAEPVAEERGTGARPTGRKPVAGNGKGKSRKKTDVPRDTPARPDSASPPETRLEIRPIPVGEIVANPAQPRKVFSAEDLEALKVSVSREGVLQPILVKSAGDKYQLIAGERRLRAAQELQLGEIPARIIDIPDGRLLELALIENIHRANLNPIELAEAYQHLMKANRWTQGELSEQLGVGRSNVANTLRLLELEADMQDAVARTRISAGHAKVLLSISDPDQRRMLFERIAEENLSVRELEEARELEVGDRERKKKSKRKSRSKSAGKKPYIISLEEELAERLGARVNIREHDGKGVLSVDFYSKEDFDRLRALLLGHPE